METFALNIQSSVRKSSPDANETTETNIAQTIVVKTTQFQMSVVQIKVAPKQ